MIDTYFLEPSTFQLQVSVNNLIFCHRSFSTTDDWVFCIAFLSIFFSSESFLHLSLLILQICLLCIHTCYRFYVPFIQYFDSQGMPLIHVTDAQWAILIYWCTNDSQKNNTSRRKSVWRNTHRRKAEFGSCKGKVISEWEFLDQNICNKKPKLSLFCTETTMTWFILADPCIPFTMHIFPTSIMI